jgi:hypothetical protein
LEQAILLNVELLGNSLTGTSRMAESFDVVDINVVLISFV